MNSASCEHGMARGGHCPACENPTPRPPSLFTLYLLGTVFQEMKEDTKKDVEALIRQGDQAIRLLPRCLPYLRAVEAKALRAEVLALLEEATRKPPTKPEGPA